MDGARIARSLKHDYSAGTDEFRESLLERCLAVLVAGKDASLETALPEHRVARELDDADLDMLAAAGDAFASHDDTDD